MKIDFDTIMNRIVKDFLFLSTISLIAIIIYGSQKEQGDINAGGMYGVIDLPFLLIILISLGLTEITKRNLKPDLIWTGNFVPIALLLICFG